MAGPNETKRILTGANNELATALFAGIALADARTNPEPHGRSYVLVPQAGGGVKLEYLERPETPTRKTGSAKFNDLKSFIAYWKLHTGPEATYGAQLYGTIEPPVFTALFDDHLPGSPGWRQFKAHFPLEHSDEWDTWQALDKKPFDSNEEMAIWFEDHIVDVVSPDPAQMMDIIINFKVKQDVLFQSAQRQSDGGVVFQYNNIVTGQAGSSGKLSVPEKFTIQVPVWWGKDSKKYQLEARFKYRLQGPKLSLWYELIRPEKVVEQAFYDMVDEVEYLASKAVLFGTPAA